MSRAPYCRAIVSPWRLPDTFTSSRSPGNPSSAQITGSNITNSTDYKASFPSGSAVIKFTSATDFDLYAAPLTADSKPVSSGTMVGNVATASGELHHDRHAGRQRSVQRRRQYHETRTFWTP
jgi:hypothetical protein